MIQGSSANVLCNANAKITYLTNAKMTYPNRSQNMTVGNEEIKVEEFDEGTISRKEPFEDDHGNPRWLERNS